jgi:hypothetical protein
MPKDKQYVFSARTTEDGLELLNAKKAELGVVTDAVNLLTLKGESIP